MKTINDFLIKAVSEKPDKIAFVFLSTEFVPVKWSYRQLLESVTTTANFLYKQGLSGKRILLLYSDSNEFIISFLACQQIGAIAIPMYPPRGSAHSDRLVKIIVDSLPVAILSKENYFNKIQKIINEANLKYKPVVADALTEKNSVEKNAKKSISIVEQPVSFIQYTSGSTGHPKGVVITHENLLHNQQLIKETFHCDQNSVLASWLPFYHDMGLIGNILHAIYTQATCVLLSPFSFFQRPALWLKMIADYKVTHSGGPNFAYDLCVDTMHETKLDELDLSSWKVAYNGSEAVKLETIERFSAFFNPAGFRKEAFFPCYGLAEATLLVSGRKNKNEHKIITVSAESLKEGTLIQETKEAAAKRIISSGSVPDEMYLQIINGQTQLPCSELQIGEICIAGKSVFKGYFDAGRNSDLSMETGNAQHFFRTGDLGFTFDGHLFVTGRSKEMIIIRGKNYYPYDIELYTAKVHEAIEKNGVAAFSVDIKGYSSLAIVAEIKRTFLHLDEQIKTRILSQIENKIIQEIGIKPHEIVLVSPMSIPRTSSGKLKRLKCAELYYADELKRIFSSQSIEVPAAKGDIETLINSVKLDLSKENIKKYLEQIIVSKLSSFEANWENEELELSEMGIDSLKAMEIINTINKHLQINLDASQIYQNNTLTGLLTMIETTLWLNATPQGQEIII